MNPPPYSPPHLTGAVRGSWKWYHYRTVRDCENVHFRWLETFSRSMYHPYFGTIAAPLADYNYLKWNFAKALDFVLNSSKTTSMFSAFMYTIINASCLKSRHFDALIDRIRKLRSKMNCLYLFICLPMSSRHWNSR